MEDPKLKVIDIEIDVLRKSAYYQIRVLVKDLKPNIFEVLKDPEFKTSSAVQELRLKLDQLTELYKQVMAETDIVAETKNKVPDNISHPKQGQDSHTMRPPVKSHSEDFRIPGTYVVGGSAFGWNFITFPGNQSVYYGRTKEAFRATQAIFS